jgi:3-isopropylmalate/(R)-2-methylmalate dehydratase large subunit
MTISEKIIAAHAGKDRVKPGEIVTVDVDVAMVNEIGAVGCLQMLEALDIEKKFADPKKAVIVADHFTPSRDIATAEWVKYSRDRASVYGYQFYEMGDGGVEHVILPEKGVVRPGMIAIAADSHTTTYGALGLFSTGVGSTDLSAIWALGKTWLKVPEAVKVTFSGKKQPWVSGKDFILFLIGKIGVDGARYKTLEYHGDTMKDLDMSDRFAIANMSVEAGAKNGVFQVDQKTEDYVRNATSDPYTIYASDEDAVYAEELTFDSTKIEPQIAYPDLPSNTHPVSEAEGIRIDQVVIGSCANGRLEDLKAAAGLFSASGRKVVAKTRCIVIPGSQKVYRDALKSGVLETLTDAGCVIAAPTCGPCVGGYMGILAANETCLSTTTRNFVGRMGDPTSKIYLGNPAVAAAAAIRGAIEHPGNI